MVQVRFKPKAGYVPSVYIYTMRTPQSTSFRDMEWRARSYLRILKLDGHPIKGAKAVYRHREAVSLKATKRSMLDREVGGELLKTVMQPGDYLIVNAAADIFTREEDLVTVMNRFLEREQHLHILSFHGAAVDCGSPAGSLLIGNLRLIHSFNQEYRVRADATVRTRARALKRLAGGGRIPFFCEPVQSSGEIRLILRSWAIPAAEVIYQYRCGKYQHERKKYPIIAGQLKRNRLGEGWDKSPKNLDDLFHFWCAWLAAGRPDVNTLKFPDFILEYRSLLARGLVVEPTPLGETDG